MDYFVWNIAGFTYCCNFGTCFWEIYRKKIYLKVPPEMNVTSPDIDSGDFPSFRLIVWIVAIPLLLILLNTFTGVAVLSGMVEKSVLTDALEFVGHPFSALIIATLAAMYFWESDVEWIRKPFST